MDSWNILSSDLNLRSFSASNSLLSFTFFFPFVELHFDIPVQRSEHRWSDPVLTWFCKTSPGILCISQTILHSMIWTAFTGPRIWWILIQERISMSVNTTFCSLVKICVRSLCHVNMMRRHWELFFFGHVELNSSFDGITKNEHFVLYFFGL